MPRTATGLWITLALLLAQASVAVADPGDPPVGLARGELLAQLALESSVAPGELLKPISIAPDAWLGITDRWTLGITHSDAALDRVGFGASVCLRDGGPIGGYCSHAYRGGAVDARYLVLRRGGLQLAPRARFVVRDIDPWKPAVTLGALGAWVHGRWSVTADPYLQLGLENRDRGNRAELLVPIYGAVRIARVRLELESGYASDLATWRDGFHVPVALDAAVRVTPCVTVAAQAGFTSLIGPQNNVKQREVWLLATWRGRALR